MQVGLKMVMQVASAVIKRVPSDFFVAEQLGFAPDGQGEHLWCYVEKCGMNTAFLKKEWARLCGCLLRDIAHSGLKDRHGVTRQWLSLPAVLAVDLPPFGDGWKILERQRNSRKLRIGTHRHNDFILLLRDVVGEREAINHALDGIKASGFANAFGEQRFGHNNMAKALSWVSRGELPRKHDERAQVLSSLRAECFNRQLQYFLSTGDVRAFLVGDRAMLAGSNSHFEVKDIDDTICARLVDGDIAVAGWLPGKEKLALPPRVLAWREQETDVMQEMIRYLECYAESGWRALNVRVPSLQYDWCEENTLRLSFTLSRGSYATALLDSIFLIEDAAQRADI